MHSLLYICWHCHTTSHSTTPHPLNRGRRRCTVVMSLQGLCYWLRHFLIFNGMGEIRSVHCCFDQYFANLYVNTKFLIQILNRPLPTTYLRPYLPTYLPTTYLPTYLPPTSHSLFWESTDGAHWWKDWLHGESIIKLMFTQLSKLLLFLIAYWVGQTYCLSPTYLLPSRVLHGLRSFNGQSFQWYQTFNYSLSDLPYLLRWLMACEVAHMQRIQCTY